MIQNTFTWPGHTPGDPVHDRIVAYLTVDIQKSPTWSAELMQKIYEVRTGILSSWERPGNAYCLYIYPEYVEIEDDYTDETDKIITVPIATFAAAVEAWQAKVSRDHIS